MTLLSPIYLWGLLALAVPIAIHLWSKKKVQTIKVGSTQFITETQSKQSRSINLNEWWLLLLRCLAIALLVFILAEPRLHSPGDNTEVTYIFEPSLLVSSGSKERFKNIPMDSRRLLVPGFPKWEADSEIPLSEKIPDYWQLARQMSQLPSDSIVVFTNAFASGVKGKRPAISANVQWVDVAFDGSLSETVQARRVGDSIELLDVKSDGGYLAFAKAKQHIKNFNSRINTTGDSLKVESQNGEKWIPLVPSLPIKVTLVYDEPMVADLEYLEAAFRAIGTYVEREVLLTTIKSEEEVEISTEDPILWYSTLPLRASNQSVLLLRPNALASTLIVEGPRPNLWYLTQSLTVANVLNNRLAEALLAWLNIQKEVENNLEAYDKRTVAVDQLETNKLPKETEVVQNFSADCTQWLWMLLGILLIAERILARFRKQ